MITYRLPFSGVSASLSDSECPQDGAEALRRLEEAVRRKLADFQRYQQQAHSNVAWQGWPHCSLCQSAQWPPSAYARAYLHPSEYWHTPSWWPAQWGE